MSNKTGGYKTGGDYQTFLFQVTPQKQCCLWKNSKDCADKNLGCYCCKPGSKGRPVSFRFTPDSERWKYCDKINKCPNGAQLPGYGPNHGLNPYGIC